MLFNSIGYALFLPVVFITYWLLKHNLKRQNWLLLISSYFFYACWSYKFLFLLIFSTVLDYATGIKISESENVKVKRFWFWLSIIVNVGFLGVFKYYNFFSSSFQNGLGLLGLQVNLGTLNVILPIGISFYTFHGLSYVIDIYKGKIKPEKNFINYSVFVCFFPLLVAGPIERATHLLPQIQKKRQFNYTQAADGLRQILWGLFKKIVIADNCAEFANIVFNNSSTLSGSTLVIGAVFFSFKIYCDFSGYSDIALGTAKLFGIELLRNFSFPYFSRDMAEFWRRWHISLSSWFKDYLYIPLGGSRGDIWLRIRNVLIIFIVSGFWHGANWTFIIWGLLNALYVLPSVLFKTNRNHLGSVATGRSFPTFKEILQMGLTFSLTVFAWIFFRAENVKHAFSYISRMFSKSFFSIPQGKTFIPASNNPLNIILLIIVFMLLEWRGRSQQYALANLGLKWPRIIRWSFYYGIIIVIFYFSGTSEQFIYFQF